MLSVSYYRICQGPPGGWDCCSAWVPRSFQLPTTLLAKNSPPPRPWVHICLVPLSRGAADPAAHWLLQWLTSLPDPRLYDEDSDDKGHRGDNCLPSDCFLRPCFMHTKRTHSKAMPSSARIRGVSLPRLYFLLSWDPMAWFSSEMPLYQLLLSINAHYCCYHLGPRMLQWFLIYFMMNFFLFFTGVCVWTCVHVHKCVQWPGHVWKSEDIFFFWKLVSFHYVHLRDQAQVVSHAQQMLLFTWAHMSKFCK